MTVNPKFTVEAEPFIPYADEKACPPHLRAALDELKARMGYLPNSLRLYLHNPAVLGAVLAMSAIPKSEVLDRRLKKKLGIICSSTNGCVYCTSHQCAFLLKPGGAAQEGWGGDEAEAADLISGRAEPADEVERICFDFARAASDNPGGVSDEIRDRMRRHLTPAQVMELAAVVGFWKFMNTIHDSLNLPLEAQNFKYSGYLDAWH